MTQGTAQVSETSTVTDVTSGQISREKALVFLLTNGVVALGRGHGQEGWPEEARGMPTFEVNCSDVFAWGCVDSETVLADDIEALYRFWLREPGWGALVWCMSKRRELPQEPVLKMLRKSPEWDVQELVREHGLRLNHYDGVSGVVAGRQYETYKAWAESQGMQVLPWDEKWWDGWKAYTDAHPGWNSPEWEREDDRLIREWKTANGFAGE